MAKYRLVLYLAISQFYIIVTAEYGFTHILLSKINIQFVVFARSFI